MYVCLMRHGKAQPFELHQPDKLRELTEKGCNQASSMAKWAASWWPSGKTALWVSPYVRTCQTASYLEKYLPIEQFHTHKAIASGDLVAVYDEILSRETADVVCLIGHSPFLDRWARPGRGRLSISSRAAWPCSTSTFTAAASVRHRFFFTLIRRP